MAFSLHVFIHFASFFNKGLQKVATSIRKQSSGVLCRVTVLLMRRRQCGVLHKRVRQMLQASVCSSQRKRQCNEIRNSLRGTDQELQQPHDRMLLQQGLKEAGPDGGNEGPFSLSSR